MPPSASQAGSVAGGEAALPGPRGAVAAPVPRREPRKGCGRVSGPVRLRRGPATTGGSDRPGRGAASPRHSCGWLLLPVPSAPCHLRAGSVFRLITRLGLFRASFARPLTGMPFLPLLFLFFFSLLLLFWRTRVCAFHIWSSNVLSSAVWLRLPPLRPADSRAKCAHRVAADTAGRTEPPLLTVAGRASLLNFPPQKIIKLSDAS